MPRLWPAYDLDDIDQRDEAFLERVAGWIEKFHARYHRARVFGIDRIPGRPVLFVGNHNAGLYTPDTFIFAWALWRERGVAAVPYGLAHEVVLGAAPINRLLVPLGAVRACHENAQRLFDAGRNVLVYPGGDVDAMRPWRHRHRVVFDDRRGYIRLALRCGVPIVPFVTAGAHSSFVVIDDLRWLARAIRADSWMRLKVWPLIACAPWGLAMGPAVFYLPFPARIWTEVLAPIEFARLGPEAAADTDYVTACATQVHSAMQTGLTRLAEARRAGIDRP